MQGVPWVAGLDLLPFGVSAVAPIGSNHGFHEAYDRSWSRICQQRFWNFFFLFRVFMFWGLTWVRLHHPVQYRLWPSIINVGKLTGLCILNLSLIFTFSISFECFRIWESVKSSLHGNVLVFINAYMLSEIMERLIFSSDWIIFFLFVYFENLKTKLQLTWIIKHSTIQQICILLNCYIMKNFKHTEKWEELLQQIPVCSPSRFHSCY